MDQQILAISGKPGLYSLISRGRSTLIVEALDNTHKRQSVGLRDRITALSDISMYTTDDDTPLMQVFQNIYEKRNGQVIDIDPKKADKQTLADFMAEALPNYDTERVYPGDIKKLIAWYNILIQAGITDFSMPDDEEDEAPAEQPEA